jgi:hypothetical protein
MKFLGYIFILFLFFPLLGAGQSIKLLNATQQGWLGGEAGHYGINYYVEFSTPDYSVTPDTLWVKNNPYSIDFTEPNNVCKRKIDSVKHKVTYFIAVGEAHDEQNEMGNFIKADKDPTKKKPEKRYNGAALLEYSFKGKKYYYEIKQFRKLEPVSYP